MGKYLLNVRFGFVFLVPWIYLINGITEGILYYFLLNFNM